MFSQYYISLDRWPRFFFYSRRVRHISLLADPPYIHHEVFTTISISRPELALFPNLLCLTIAPISPLERTVPHISLFLHQGLKRLRICNGNSDPDAVSLPAWSQLFADVVFRAPNITHIQLSHEWSTPLDTTHSLSNFLGALKNLRILELFDSMLTSDVVSALSHCPELTTIQAVKRSPYRVRIVPPNHPLPDIPSDLLLENFYPALEEGAFPSLRAITLRANLWHCVTFLQQPAFPAHRLKTLRIHSLHAESATNAQRLFAAIAEACVNIKRLGLIFSEINIGGGVAGEQTEFISFACIQPLVKCTSLTELSLNTLIPLKFTDAEAVILATHWPNMTQLALNNNPFPIPGYQHELSLGGALTAFATGCPRLQVLGLYVRPCVPSIPPTALVKRFENLKTLDLGISTTSADDNDWTPQDIALFLTEVTTPTCTITHASHSSIIRSIAPALIANPNHSIDDEEELITGVTETSRKFHLVIELIPLLRSVHASYRERMRALEGEVERLTLGAGAGTL